MRGSKAPFGARIAGWGRIPGMVTPHASWPTHFAPEVVPRAPSSDALSSICISLEAWRRGLSVTFNSGNLHFYTISDGEKEVRFNCALPASITRREDEMRLRRKWVATEILESNGLPVPRSIFFSIGKTTEQEVRDYVDRVGYPLVVKPNMGSVGRGVFIDLTTWEEVQESLRFLQETGTDDVIMQAHHHGDDIRVLVVGDQVVGAVRRIPANVVGDGVQSVGALIRAKNLERRRNPFLSKGVIRVDHEVERCLHDQQLTVDSIPSAGAHVYLRKVANASAGGDVIDITEDLPEAIKAAAVDAVRVMPNIVISGVDILHDTSTGEFVIIEMNRRPHIAVNMYPTAGTGRDVPKAFVDFFFPNSRRGDDVDYALLRFDPAPIRRILLSRASDGVSISPLPRRRFPFRRIYSFEDVDENFSMSPKQETLILREAGRRRISGSVRRRDARIELLVAALRESSVEKLLDVVTSVLGVEVRSTRGWVEVVTLGFNVDPSLVERER